MLMETAARVIPVVTFSNTVKDILDYIVKRTSNTIGEQVDRSQVVVVGSVQESEARSLPVRPEHAAVLKPWLSGEADVGPQIFVHVTTVRVEMWLVGPGESKKLVIAYVYPAMTTTIDTDFVPIFDVQDRGLLFLQKVPSDLPYAPHIPKPAYQLASGEKWVRNFLVTDYDEQGQPFKRDETAKVEETISAVQWYAALPRKEPETLHQALLQALDNANPQVVRCAIRFLAHQGDSNTARVFKERLQKTTEDLHLRLMLGFWILGEKETAENVLKELFRIHGKDAWLARWEVKSTLVEEGQLVNTLYGPDPSELKGD